MRGSAPHCRLVAVWVQVPKQRGPRRRSLRRVARGGRSGRRCRLDQKRTNRDHATIAISRAAIAESTVDGCLLAESPQGKAGSAASADGDRSPPGCNIAEASRHVAPQLGEDEGVCVCLEKSGDLHRGRNRNNKAVVNGDDHTRSAIAAAPFECPAYGFLCIRPSGEGPRSRRRDRQRLSF